MRDHPRVRPVIDKDANEDRGCHVVLKPENRLCPKRWWRGEDELHRIRLVAER
jgi:hypothetical protein